MDPAVEHGFSRRRLRSTASLKVGVLTFHRCINYGSYWQARCLVEGLRSQGVKAVLLDHESKSARLAEWRCAFQPLLPRRSSRADLPLYAAKARSILTSVDRLPRSSQFPLHQPEQAGNYDLVIVGSDEVWNAYHPWYGRIPAFYGVGLQTNMIASYAASFGTQHAADGMDATFAELLRSFASISVRDDNSQQLIKATLGLLPRIVLDPCLQFASRVRSSGEAPRTPYIAVYGHSFPDWFAEAVRRAAKRRNLRLISIGYRNDWADEQEIAAGPEEFAGLIAHSTGVATNFFHGCVFSLLNRKPFACAESTYRSNKIQGLLRLLGAHPHMVSENDAAAECERLLSEPPDSSVQQRITQVRSESTEYLNHVIAAALAVA